MISSEIDETSNLHAAIYLTKFIETEYLHAEGPFKFGLQEAILQSFLAHHSSKIRNQLRVGIMRLIITDFPKSKIFELLIDSLSEDKAASVLSSTPETLATVTSLYYYVFKALCVDKENNHKVK